MLKSQSTVILYSGGSYGTYLHWMLYALTHPAEIFDPTTAKGNSHNLDKLVSAQDYQKVLEFGLEEILNMPVEQIPVITRLHPKTSGDQYLGTNINQLLDRIEKLIVVYPTRDTYLLNINNYYYKIWDDPWTGPLAHVDPENIYRNFPVAHGTPLNQLPKWVVREYISYDLFSSWESQVEWYFTDQFQDPRCLYVYVDQILNDPLGTVDRIKQFMNLDWVRSPEAILPYHNKNLSLQKYLNQDQLCCKIVQATLNNTLLTWTEDELTLPSEAWIQKDLRDRGFGLQCHELNQFPTNSLTLSKLLYKL